MKRLGLAGTVQTWFDYSPSIRGIRRLAARMHGRGALSDGRLEVVSTRASVNWWFQRVLGLNHECRFPVHFTSVVNNPERIVCGRNVARSLASSGGLYIQGLNGIEIGDDVMIGPGVKIISANHVVGAHDEWCASPPIVIGARAWIGANAVLLPGIRIGEEAVVGAGAVVTKDVASGATVVGIPARQCGHTVNLTCR